MPEDLDRNSGQTKTASNGRNVEYSEEINPVDFSDLKKKSPRMLMSNKTLETFRFGYRIIGDGYS